jgi:hypothetical protein
MIEKRTMTRTARACPAENPKLCPPSRRFRRSAVNETLGQKRWTLKERPIAMAAIDPGLTPRSSPTIQKSKKRAIGLLHKNVLPPAREGPP